MRLGIMQPYFFPYLGYFDLINCADLWVVFDTAQYIRHGWVNRNRILHPKKDWQYIMAPVKKHSQKTAIKDIEVQDGAAWKQRILAQIQHYKKNSYRRFRETHALMEQCLDTDDTSITAINVRCLSIICEQLEIPFQWSIFSRMNLDLGPVEGPGDWALRISEAMGADEYINPPGGEGLFDRKAFARLGIKLTIRQLPSFQYECRGYEYEPDLSIVDLLMWNSPYKIKRYLDRHKM